MLQALLKHFSCHKLCQTVFRVTSLRKEFLAFCVRSYTKPFTGNMAQAPPNCFPYHKPYKTIFHFTNCAKLLFTPQALEKHFHFTNSSKPFFMFCKTAFHVLGLSKASSMSRVFLQNRLSCHKLCQIAFCVPSPTKPFTMPQALPNCFPYHKPYKRIFHFTRSAKLLPMSEAS